MTYVPFPGRSDQLGGEPVGSLENPEHAAWLAAAFEQWRLAFARGDHSEVERLVRLCRADRDAVTERTSTDWFGA